jgi:hypothetical protein
LVLVVLLSGRLAVRRSAHGPFKTAREAFADACPKVDTPRTAGQAARGNPGVNMSVILHLIDTAALGVVAMIVIASAVTLAGLMLCAAFRTVRR